MTRMVFSCTDFPDADSCCSSCHCDESELGIAMCEEYADWAEPKASKRGHWAAICCQVSNSINFKNRKTWADAIRRRRSA